MIKDCLYDGEKKKGEDFIKSKDWKTLGADYIDTFTKKQVTQRTRDQANNFNTIIENIEKVLQIRNVIIMRW